MFQQLEPIPEMDWRWTGDGLGVAPVATIARVVEMDVILLWWTCWVHDRA